MSKIISLIIGALVEALLRGIKNAVNRAQPKPELKVTIVPPKKVNTDEKRKEEKGKGLLTKPEPPDARLSEMRARLRKDVEAFKQMGPYEIMNDPAIWKKGNPHERLEGSAEKAPDGHH